jgi:glycerol-3-phosphate acyltransferase PlsY
MSVVLVCGLAFALGAIPFALLVVRACKGIDVRTVGSGNVGATNASRAFATQSGRLIAFAAIYALDAAKGFVPAWWGPEFAPALPAMTVGVLGGSAAVLGHVFTPLLGFRGGKGVATATGALFALDWLVAAIAIGVFFVVRAATGHVFFGSLALATALPIAAIAMHADTAFGERLAFTLLCALLAALLFWTHRSNLQKHFAARTVGGA